jgi:hypothetical protein
VRTTFISTFLLALLFPVPSYTQNSQPKREMLSDGVERWYVPAPAGGKSYLTRRFEEIYNVVFSKNTRPFGRSVAFLAGVGKYQNLSPQLPSVRNDIRGKGGLKRIQAYAEFGDRKHGVRPMCIVAGAGGKKLLRDTHVSTSDVEARLYKKSDAGESKPSYLGHVIVENRKGLVVAACATPSSTTAKREAALQMVDALGLHPQRGSEPRRPITLGADKLYQEEKFIADLRRRQVVPHVAEYEPNPHWPNWLTEAERNDPGFAISQKKRKLVEKVFGWAKLDSILRQVKLRGVKKVDWLFRFVAAAANLVRMVKLIPAV